MVLRRLVFSCLYIVFGGKVHLGLAPVYILYMARTRPASNVTTVMISAFPRCAAPLSSCASPASLCTGSHAVPETKENAKMNSLLHY